MKTGSSKSKLKDSKTGSKKVKKNTVTEMEGLPEIAKKTRKPSYKMERVVSASPKWKYSISDESIPAWVRESNEKKPKRAEWSESKLQWRKVTKKSERSFSKNKAQDYRVTKPTKDIAPSDARGSFRNTFDKTATYEWETRRSSWDPTSKKPGIGFEKSKTGYKWVGSAWDKSSAPRVSTRTWDDVGDKPARAPDIKSKSSKKSVSEKDNHTPYVPPVVTWKKETEVINKKELVDPTK